MTHAQKEYFIGCNPVHALLSMLLDALVQDLTTGEELVHVGEVRYDGASGRVFAYLQAADALEYQPRRC